MLFFRTVWEEIRLFLNCLLPGRMIRQGYRECEIINPCFGRIQKLVTNYEQENLVP